MKPEARAKALRILQNPSLYLPLLFTAYAMDTDEKLADWLAKSLGEEAEMRIKQLLVEGFLHTREPDLIAYARRRILEEGKDAE
ncbi:hypothetical protein MQE22_08575 [Acidithiobacillus sp. YTS05]|nr:hypothetical protein MQE22_08575 [Acidithiobacillus sp. YTS05]